MPSPARAVLTTALLLLPCSVSVTAQEREVTFWDIPWQEGPTTGRLGTEAEIAVPEGCLFTGEDGVGLFNELTENLANPNERGVIVCGGGWFVFFTYNDVGHVKDDERDALDGEAILESLRRGNEEANEERVQRGWATLITEGWMSPPHYDSATHNLTWATIARSSDGEKTVNHSVRLLGRTGVMDVDLVVGPDDIAGVLPTFEGLVSGFEFVTGHRYAEWRQGDRVAEYGLTGLIVGGAAVAAVKSGVLGRLWKILVATVAAGAAGLKGLFGRRKAASAAGRA